MIPKDEAFDMIRLLIQKTKGSQLCWNHNAQDQYATDFTRFSFLIAKRQEHDSITYSFSVVLQNYKLGSIEVLVGEPGFELLQDLYNEAARNTVLTLFAEARQSMEIGVQVIRAPHGTVTTVPPSVPKPPSPEQVETILSKVAGEWRLDYSRGTEQIIIDKSGNYYIKPNEPSKGKPPNFRLAIIACNPELTTVEWRKERLNGQSLQIEVLNITDKRIEGAAKHDQHKLVYTRIK